MPWVTLGCGCCPGDDIENVVCCCGDNPVECDPGVPMPGNTLKITWAGRECQCVWPWCGCCGTIAHPDLKCYAADSAPWENKTYNLVRPAWDGTNPCVKTYQTVGLTACEVLSLYPDAYPACLEALCEEDDGTGNIFEYLGKIGPCPDIHACAVDLETGEVIDGCTYTNESDWYMGVVAQVSTISFGPNCWLIINFHAIWLWVNKNTTTGGVCYGDSTVCANGEVTWATNACSLDSQSHQVGGYWQGFPGGKGLPLTLVDTVTLTCGNSVSITVST